MNFKGILGQGNLSIRPSPQLQSGMFSGQAYGDESYGDQDLSHLGLHHQHSFLPCPHEIDLEESSPSDRNLIPIIETVNTLLDNEFDIFFKGVGEDCGFENLLGDIDKPRVFKCPFCGKEFPKSTALGGHTSKMHPREKQEQRERIAAMRQQKREGAEQILGVGKRKKISKFASLEDSERRLSGKKRASRLNCHVASKNFN